MEGPSYANSKDQIAPSAFNPATTPMKTAKTLTARELQVLALIAQGLSSHRIAMKLKISFETVKVHRRNMLKKVKAHNTFELIRMGIKRRWI
jgi:two-component system NarL family response regulator